MIGGATESELREIAEGIARQVDQLLSITRRNTSRSVVAYTLEKIRAKAEVLSEAANREHRLRRMREAYIGIDHFGEPAWDLLLDLFANSVRSISIPTSAACLAAHCPPTTALRYIDMMVGEGIIVREPHPKDKRSILIRLSEEALVSVGSYFLAVMGEKVE